MKVKLLIDLKSSSGAVIKAGTVFNDPIPAFIMKRVNRGQAEIIEGEEKPVHVFHTVRPGGKIIPSTPITKTPVAEIVIPKKSISEKSNKLFPEREGDNQ